MKFDRRFDSAVARVPAKFQSDWNPNRATSRNLAVRCPLSEYRPPFFVFSLVQSRKLCLCTQSIVSVSVTETGSSAIISYSNFLCKMCLKVCVRLVHQITHSYLSASIIFIPKSASSVRTMGLLPDMKKCVLRMRRECRKRFPRHRGLAIPTSITHVRDARAVMYAGIANLLPFESMAGKTFPAFPAHAQPAVLRIW